MIQIKNDYLILELLDSGLYIPAPNGVIYTRVAKTGKIFVDRTRIREAGYVKQNRYIITYKRKDLSGPRIIYKHFIGDLDPELMVYHKDGNVLNNKPSNLALGTMKDVNSIIVQKPDYNPIRHYKITYEIAKAIREDHKCGHPYSSLMTKYGLAKTTIADIINNRTWKEWNHDKSRPLA